MMRSLCMRELIRYCLGLFLKFITLTVTIGLPFYWFLVQLAEHGWK